MTDNGADTPSGAPATPGERLRAAREARGLSVDEVAGRLRLRPHLVAALERDDPGALGTGPYGRGQLRNYARLVGVAEDLVAPATPAAPARPAPGARTRKPGLSRPSLAPRPRSRWPMRLLTAAVLAVVAALAVMWAAGTSRTPTPAPAPAGHDARSTPPPAPPAVVTPAPLPPSALRAPGTASPGVATALPLPADAPPPATAGPGGAPPPAAAAPPAIAPGAGTDELVLTFSGPCWVEVKDSAGNRLLYRMARAGDRHALRGTAPFDVVVGSIRDVALTYNGAPWPKPDSQRAVQRLRIGN